MFCVSAIVVNHHDGKSIVRLSRNVAVSLPDRQLSQVIALSALAPVVLPHWCEWPPSLGAFLIVTVAPACFSEECQDILVQAPTSSPPHLTPVWFTLISCAVWGMLLLKKLEKERRAGIYMNSLFVILLFTISDPFVFLWLPPGVMSWLQDSTVPPPTFVLLLSNILQFYMLQAQQ